MSAWLAYTTVLMVVRTALIALFSASLALGCKAEAQLQAGTPPPAAPEPPPPPPAPEPPPVEAAADPDDVHIEGDHLVIDRMIHFALDSDEILDDGSFELLDHIAQLLKNHPEIKVMHVIGHTDKQGDKAHNKSLSDRRAAAVVKALQERGVTQSLDSRGAGMDEPLCEDATPECHEKNRRVEFLIDTA